MSFFDTVTVSPPDPIFGINASFKADKRDNKVNLTIGVYYDHTGKVVTLEAIKEAERRFPDCEPNKEYMGIGGDPELCAETGKLVFGTLYDSKKIFVAETVGGTGALRVGFEFLASCSTRVGFVSAPTWANHAPIMEKAGFQVNTYDYYRNGHVDFEAMLDSLSSAPQGSVILLHAVCHNPTGCDLNHDQWRALSTLMKERRLFPFFDFAYQGFGDGNDEDAFAIRHFMKEGHEMLVATSFSKSMGLYGERVGTIMAVTDRLAQVGTTLCAQIRCNYSNPPRHGAMLAKMLLTDPELHGLWLEELKGMRVRIQTIRGVLADALSKRVPDRDWSFLVAQKGMFSLVGLSEEEVVNIIGDHAIYMTQKGRINVSGINEGNIDVVAKAFQEVCANSAL